MIAHENFDKNKLIYNKMMEEIEIEITKELKETKLKAEDIKASILKESKVEEKRIIEKAKKIARIRQNKAKSLVEMEVKRKNLTRRYELIQKILDMSLMEMENFAINNPNYSKYLIHYIRQGVDSVFHLKTLQIKNQIERIQKFYSDMRINPKECIDETLDIIIIINQRDEKFINDGFLKELMKKYGINFKLEFQDSILGGAIIKTSDNSTSYDSSFKGRLNNLRSELISKVSRKLWP